jgi:hypothetical protein
MGLVGAGVPNAHGGVQAALDHLARTAGPVAGAVR